MSARAAASVTIGAERPASVTGAAAVSASEIASWATPAASIAPVTPPVEGRAGIGDASWIASVRGVGFRLEIPAGSPE